MSPTDRVEIPEAWLNWRPSDLLRWATEARDVLIDFIDDDPCQYDQCPEGTRYCQTHGPAPGPCRVAEARRLLGLGAVTVQGRD